MMARLQDNVDQGEQLSGTGDLPCIDDLAAVLYIYVFLKRYDTRYESYHDGKIKKR